MEKKPLDPNVIEEYYRKYSDDLLRHAYLLVKNHFDAETILQDTFATATEKYHDFITSKNPVGWLHRTMKNMVRRLFHERKVMNNILSYDEETCAVATVDSYSLFETYRDMIPDYQLSLLLEFYCEGYSCKDLAKKYGKTQANIRTTLFRARASFRKEYQKMLEEIK